jgi:hypothetical protein
MGIEARRCGREGTSLAAGVLVGGEAGGRCARWREADGREASAGLSGGRRPAVGNTRGRTETRPQGRLVAWVVARARGEAGVGWRTDFGTGLL